VKLCPTNIVKASIIGIGLTDDVYCSRYLQLWISLKIVAQYDKGRICGHGQASIDIYGASQTPSSSL
jgi:hypothetical protein